MKKETDYTSDKTTDVKTNHNNHFALRKLKDVDDHIDMMKRRFQVLKVKDDEYRSKTIQHQNKLKQYDMIRESMKKDRQSNQNMGRLKMYQIETTKEKNIKLKKEIQQKVKTARQSTHMEKVEENKKGRKEHVKNEQIFSKIKDQDLQYNQQRRKRVNKQEENQKLKVSRYLDGKIKDTIQLKTLETQDIFSVASKKQKELERLSRMEEQMVKRNSESVQVSQEMRSKLRKVLGDERRFTKLPQVRSRTSQLTNSSNSTQLVMI